MKKTKGLEGTFALNKKEAIHRWFAYMEGYSDALVEKELEKIGYDKVHTIYDPFGGSGTSLLTASKHNIVPDDEAFELILTLGTLDFKRFVILKTPFRMPIGCQSPQSSIKSYILQIRFSIGPREFIPRGFNL